MGDLVSLADRAAPRVIHRTRVPLEMVNPATGQIERGFGDTWTRDKARADERAASAAGAFVETLTMTQILEFEPAAQLKARAAWANAYPDD